MAVRGKYRQIIVDSERVISLTNLILAHPGRPGIKVVILLKTKIATVLTVTL